LNKALQTPLFSVRDFKERALLHLGRGNLKAAFADFDRALYYANKRLEQNPNLVYNWEKRAALYRELNLPEHAASDIHKASQLSPNDPYIKQFHYTPSYVSRYFLQFSPFQAYTEALRKKLGPPTHQAPQAPA
jgi:tetratricopeptide (TPR) repeat protein